MWKDDLRLLNTTEAARVMGVKRKTVLKWIERGFLMAVKPGGRDWAISLADLESMNRRPVGRPKKARIK